MAGAYLRNMGLMGGPLAQDAILRTVSRGSADQSQVPSIDLVVENIYASLEKEGRGRELQAMGISQRETNREANLGLNRERFGIQQDYATLARENDAFNREQASSASRIAMGPGLAVSGLAALGNFAEGRTRNRLSQDLIGRFDAYFKKQPYDYA